MATVVRVKRRLDEDPVESLVLRCKKTRTNNFGDAPLATPECTDEVKSVFKFAGTLTDKDTTLTQCVDQAIKKGKLQSQYRQRFKSHNATSTAERRLAAAVDARYRVVAQRRTINELSLSVDDTSDALSDGTDKSANDGSASETSRKDIFCLCDIEKMDGTEKTSSNSASAGTSQNIIMCNGVPMVRETIQPSHLEVGTSAPATGTSDYVYDVYYTNDNQFDFRSLERVLAVEAFGDQENQYMYAEDDDASEEDEAAYDEDDENAENNWRNDYPDDDPMYFEKLQLDDEYGSEDEYGADRWYEGDKSNGSDDNCGDD